MAVVLLVDNNQDFLDTSAEYLTHKGYEVLIAADSLTANHLFLDRRPDVTVVDVRLRDDNDPHDTSGLFLVRQWCASGHIPNIILTRVESAKLVREVLKPELNGRALGVNFILKHEGLPALYEAITNALTIDPRLLYRRIIERFSDQELKELCYVEVLLDYESLSGQDKRAKALSLVQYFERRHELHLLRNVCTRKRPNAVW